MKKIISLNMALIMTLAACAPGGSSGVSGDSPAQAAVKVRRQEIASLVSGEKTNMVWAEYLAEEISKENRLTSSPQRDLAKWAGQLDAFDKDWQNTRWRLIAEKSLLVANSKFIEQTVSRQMTQLQGQGVFDVQVQFQNAVLINNESLKKIFDIYNRQLQRNSKIIAKDFVQSWSKEQPDLIAKIDAAQGENIEQKTQAILVLITEWDRKFAAYDFAKEDNAKLLIYSLVAAQLAEVLQNNTTVKQIISAVKEVQNIARTVQETMVLIQSIAQYRKELAKDWKAMGSSFDQMMKSVSFYKGQLDSSQMVLSDKTKEGVRNIMEDMITGSVKTSANPEDKSFLSDAYPLDKNFNDFVDSAVRVASSAEGIVNVTRALSKTLNIPLSEDVEKVLTVTSQVAQGFKVGQAVMQAFQSQGLIGAMSTFSGAGGIALVAGAFGAGGGGGNAEVLGAIAGLKKDIKEVKEMQKKVLEQQLATLEMVTEVAVMIDQYHRQTMMGFERLTDQVVVGQEMINILRLSDLNECRLMWANIYEGQERKYALNKASVQNLSSRQATFNQRQRALVEYMKSSLGQEKARICIRAFERVFEPAWPIADGNLLARHNQNLHDQNIVITESKLFFPALNYLAKKNPKTDWASEGWHLPVASFAAYEKYKSLESSGGERGDQFVDMRNLLSPYLLEKYGTTLLEIHLALYGLTEDGTKVARRQIKEALHRTNVAIAQAAVLSGEPLMGFLLNDWNEVRGTTNCSQVDPSKEAWMKTLCFATTNGVILSNLVSYRVHKMIQDYSGPRAAAYIDLRQRRDISGMAQFLGVVATDLGVGEKGMFIKFDKEEVLLPEVKLHQSLNLKYDSSMPTLLKLQQALSQELVRLTPQYLKSEQTEILVDTLLYRNMR